MAANRNPFLDTKINNYLPSLGQQTDAINQRIISSRPVFTSADGKTHPVTLQFASENEFAPERYWKGDGKHDKDKIQEAVKSDLNLQKALSALGIAPDLALAEASQFTQLDCMMFDIHKSMLGKAEFNFGQDCHGRGYYDTPVPTDGSYPYPIPEVRLQPQEASQFLANHHELLETCKQVFDQNDFSFSNSSNHLNFSFWIPNDGTYAQHKDALSQDGASVNLFVLAKYDEHAFQYVKNAVAGIATVFSETGFVRDSSAKSDIVHDVGTSRGNSLRLCKDRCEYRYGKGMEENMSNLVLSVVKGVELATSEHAGIMTSVEKKTGCNVTFKDKAAADPDAHLFTRRMFEGAHLIAKGEGSFGFSPNPFYYSENGSKVDQEMFGLSPGFSVMGGSGGRFSGEIIKGIFDRVILKGDKLDASKAVDWMKTQSCFAPASIEVFKDCIADIASVQTYRTFGTEQV